MPHAISPHCLEPAAALIGLSSPIDFDAPDGVNVDVVFALVWPRNRPQEFLKLSASINRVLTDPAMVHLVRRSAAPDLIRRSMYLGAQAGRDRDAMQFRAQPPHREAAPLVAPSSIQRGANGA